MISAEKMHRSKGERLKAALAIVEGQAPCRNGLEAYRQISDALNQVEDESLGVDSWRPPRSFVGHPSSSRLYPTYPESMLALPDYPGNMVLWHAAEVVIISRFGAIEVRTRNGRSFEELTQDDADQTVYFTKLDGYGDGVWHGKNRS